MDFDSEKVDVGGVDDRRGSGGRGKGLMFGGGGGLFAVLLTVIVLIANGGKSSSALDQIIHDGQVSGTGPSESASQLQERCNSADALSTYTDCRLIKIYDVINSTWSDEFKRRHLKWRPPRLVFFSGSTTTGCGEASAQVGPFYCPADERIYLDLDFLAALEQQFGISGQFAQAYIVAHEAGHHIQKLLGIEAKVRAEQQQSPKQANALSVRLELQADCYAGVWSKLADQETDGNGIALKAADVNEALKAAAAVGDDRIQKAAGQSVNPETWTHGSAAQRSTWFKTGLDSGDIDRCDTFAS